MAVLRSNEGPVYVGSEPGGNKKSLWEGGKNGINWNINPVLKCLEGGEGQFVTEMKGEKVYAGLETRTEKVVSTLKKKNLEGGGDKKHSEVLGGFWFSNLRDHRWIAKKQKGEGKTDRNGIKGDKKGIHESD